MRRYVVLNARRQTAQSLVRRRYAQACAEEQADGSWRVYTAPQEAQAVRQVIGKGSNEREAWADAAGRQIR